MPQHQHQLTAKQEHFAQLVASGLKQGDAYRQAYNVSSTTLPDTVYENASHLASDTNVAPRIQELKAAAQATVAASQAWNLDRLVTEAETNLNLSRIHKQLGSANGALELIGRATGILSDKPRDQLPVQITRVVVVLSDGRQQPGPELPEGRIVPAVGDEKLHKSTGVDNENSNEEE